MCELDLQNPSNIDSELAGACMTTSVEIPYAKHPDKTGRDVVATVEQ